MSNGFEDFQKVLRKVQVDDAIVVAAQREAAEFYVQKLLPNIPKSKRTKHMANDVHVTVTNGEVQVRIAEWYWRFPEKGTIHQKATNYARNTLKNSSKQIAEMMQKRIIKEMGL